ncbi:sensor histidine kinase [Desulfatitalea tepidiphila]|uniref:sensor histidine kinase n=1 Tax=Desulfatitalea tepidiphila TaxID=1185843 RepID=UPI0006B477CE|nr:HAMP domain-containing sensor histidine kinase [Desulfatitalea tepidiphila]
MHRRHFKRFFHSVFFRLVAVIALAGILMTLTVMGGFYTLRRNMADAFRLNFAQYIHYLVQDIGDPPDRMRAQAISARTGMMIHFEGPDGSWTIPQGTPLPDFSSHRHLWHDSPKVQVGAGREGHFILVAHGGGRLIFWRLKSEAFERQAVKTLVMVCIVLMLILAAAYLYIRRVMQPVRWLTAAMDQYGDGNLGYRMPLRRSDEFQDLAASVNHMAERIQNLLASKEKLLLDVSHELRSPIARMKVAVELLDDETTRAGLREDLDEMEAMVTDILETARLRQSAAGLDLREVDMSELIRSVTAEFTGQTPAVEAATIEAAAVRVDPQKARTVLKNVIDNAVKYSGPESGPVKIAAGRDGTEYRITVQDHGIGIPPEDLDRVFEPFFRVDPSRSRATGGFGLGLSLCKAIMASHGGSIHIDSQPGQGSRVTILFPMLKTDPKME